MAAPKRKRDDQDEINLDDLPDVDTINRLLDEAPAVEALDEAGLKRALISFEKKITNNTMLRLKFAKDPQKFMDSELELDEEIKKLHILAASPELYPVFIKLRAPESLLKLLMHENPDISIDAVELLYELTDSDTMAESEEAVLLIDNIVKHNGLELLVQTLQRFDEKVPEEKHGAYRLLNILENFIELKPDIQSIVAEKSEILKYLVQRIGDKQFGFDENKLYCSELLAILLQNNSENQQRAAKLDAIDCLLVVIAPYKKVKATDEEEEFVENCFDSLCSLLLLKENQDSFVKAEGLELMLLLLKAKNFTRSSALKVIDFALSGNSAACGRFVDFFTEALGLKSLFAAFMKPPKQKSDQKEAEDDEHVISAIASLFQYTSGDVLKRVVGKFSENDYEKIDRLLELREKYSNSVDAAAAEHQKDHEGDEEEEDEEEKYLARLEAGLFKVQMCDLIAASIAANPFSEAMAERLYYSLNRKDISIESIKRILDEYAALLGDAQGADARAAKQAQITTLVEKLLAKKPAEETSAVVPPEEKK